MKRKRKKFPSRRCLTAAPGFGTSNNNHPVDEESKHGIKHKQLSGSSCQLTSGIGRVVWDSTSQVARRKTPFFKESIFVIVI